MRPRVPAYQESALADRLLALWDHLGLGVAHVATQMPGDLADFVRASPSRLGGVVLCAPTRLDPAPFAEVADRLLMVCGSTGLTADVTAAGAKRLPDAKRIVLADYEAPGWADVMADRTDDIVAGMVDFLGSHPADVPKAESRRGSHAGITWRIEGSGPALVLLPFFLAPSQWTPALPRLTQHFTTIILGGPHIGGVAALEDRARAPTYQAMFRTLVDLLSPTPGAAILDVGCGSGALDRLLARRLAGACKITAIDVNPFLLQEAAALAEADDVAGTIRFAPGSAETLPFDDATFDCIFSVTVLEECDADRALAEMVRVAKPGGRVGVIVRSIDLPQWWNVALAGPVERKMTTPPQSVAAKGVADASLYRRARAAGLVDLVCFPSLVTLDQPQGPIWRYREDHLLAQLTAEELESWHAAREKAREQELLFMAHPMHCVVGRKP
ncbi:MAG: methyltransferase domain-containing protein [Alphaproteobacteria bacterium]|nr:methyltransferase domain-containing protein [Alphaproteobacteria bacterium]